MKQFNDKILISYPILSLENFQENFFTHQSPTSALTDYETANFAGNVAVFVFNLQGSVAECKNLRLWYRFSLFEKCLPIHSGSILLNSARLLEEMLGNHYRDCFHKKWSSQTIFMMDIREFLRFHADKDIWAVYT